MSIYTQKWGSRRGLKRYFCPACHKSFSINHQVKPIFWVQYIDGTPLRKLADQRRCSPAKVFRQVELEIRKLPDNTYLSLEYSTRWAGILNLDGKYIKVRGNDKKIPFIYGLDFLTHDLPVGILAPSESEQAYLKFFRLLKTISYPLRVVICDDVSAVKSGLFRYYPKARIQLCHNHFFENLRNYLGIRTDETYRSFFYDLQSAFSTKLKPHERKARLAHITYNSRKSDVLLAIMSNIEKRY